MPKFTLLHRKRLKAMRRSLETSNSWSNADFFVSGTSERPSTARRAPERARLSLFGADEKEEESLDISAASSQDDFSETEQQRWREERSPVFDSSQPGGPPSTPDQGGPAKRRFLAELSPTFAGSAEAADISDSTPTAAARLVCVEGRQRPKRRAGQERRARRKGVKNGLCQRLQMLHARWKSAISVWRHAARSPESGQATLELLVLGCASLFAQVDVRCRVFAGDARLLGEMPADKPLHLLVSKALHECNEWSFSEGSTLLVAPPWERHESDAGVFLWNLTFLAVDR